MRKLLSLVLLLASFCAAQDVVVGLTLAGGGWFDRSFNEATWLGVSRAASALAGQRDVDVILFDGSADFANDGMRSIARSGVSLIVSAGFLQAGAIQEVSSEFPNVSFVLIDEEVANPNVRSVTFRANEGSFMVGYIAGAMSQTGVVGFVGGMDISLIRNFEVGFADGVRNACQECRVISNYVGTTPDAFNNPARGRELAQAQHQQGADIIYAAAGNSGTGVIEFVNTTMCYNAAQLGVSLRSTTLTERLGNLAQSPAYSSRCAGQQPLFFIGVDSNQNYLGDTDDNPRTLNHGLTSMLKRVDLAAENAIYDVVNGTFRGGIVQNLGLAEDGVGFAIDQFNQALFSEALIARISGVREQVVSGQYRVPEYVPAPAPALPVLPEIPAAPEGETTPEVVPPATGQ